jgi:hypothetical protein
MATEEGHNELFSVARKVIILLISFKVTGEPSGVAILFKLSVSRTEYSTVVKIHYFPSNP